MTQSPLFEIPVETQHEIRDMQSHGGFTVKEAVQTILSLGEIAALPSVTVTYRGMTRDLPGAMVETLLNQANRSGWDWTYSNGHVTVNH